jgi:hypothetical protein
MATEARLGRLVKGEEGRKLRILFRELEMSLLRNFAVKQSK